MSSHQPSQEQVLAWLDEACGEGRAPMFVRSAVQEVVGKAVAWAVQMAEPERPGALACLVADWKARALAAEAALEEALRHLEHWKAKADEWSHSND